MSKQSLNVVPNVYNRLKTSLLPLAWPWSGRSLPKGNQWECWDPGLGPNVVGLLVHLPCQCLPDTPYTPASPLTPPNPCWPPEPPTLPASPQCTSDTLHLLLAPLHPYTPASGSAATLN